MRWIRNLSVVVFLLMALTGGAFATDEKEKAATEAAAPWLGLVDSGQFGESWVQASGDFRRAASKEQWINALKTVRTPQRRRSWAPRGRGWPRAQTNNLKIR